jgi:hypothetical protein
MVVALEVSGRCKARGVSEVMNHRAEGGVLGGGAFSGGGGASTESANEGVEVEVQVHV